MCPNQCKVFKISKGMCKKARDLVVMTLNNARKEYIFWPDAEERREIAQRIERNYQVGHVGRLGVGGLIKCAWT